MRIMMQMWIPVEAGNNAARAGTLGATLETLLEPLKPEAAYFLAGPTGERGAIVVFDLRDTSEIPAVAEPFFLLYNARITFTPVMNAQDLAKAVPSIDKAVKAHG